MSACQSTPQDTRKNLSRCPLRNSGKLEMSDDEKNCLQTSCTAISSQPQIFPLVELKLDVLCINSWWDRIWACEQSHLCIREMRHITARIHNWNTKFRWTMVCLLWSFGRLDKHVSGSTRIGFHSVSDQLYFYPAFSLHLGKIGHSLRPSFYAHTRYKRWLVFNYS